MLKLLLVSVFGRVNSDTNDRVNSLYDYLPFETKIVTTDFSHRDKKYHDKASTRNVEFLHVTSYKKNLSFTRIFSHWTFAIRLLIFLIKYGKKYDVIYCLIPTPTSALICSIYKWFNKETILIIDLIDIWPESLIPINNSYKLISPIMIPWKWLSIAAFKSADAIFAATKKYHDIAKKYNSKVFSSYYPLGIDLAKIIKKREESVISVNKRLNELWICYAGNLGASYDFEAMINVVQSVSSKTYHIRLLIVGGGLREKELKNKLERLGIDFIITGNVPYHDYLKYLSLYDIGLNIYVRDSEVAQSYKFNDYIASNLFVINNLKGETAELIEKYNVGINHFEDNQRLGETLRKVIENWPSIHSKINSNCSNLISEELSKEKIYRRMERDIYSLFK